MTKQASINYPKLYLVEKGQQGNARFTPEFDIFSSFTEKEGNLLLRCQ